MKKYAVLYQRQLDLFQSLEDISRLFGSEEASGLVDSMQHLE